MTIESDNGSQASEAAAFISASEPVNESAAPVVEENQTTEESSESEPAEKDDFSKKFAALSRKEKEQRTEREDFERQMAEFKQMKEEFEASKEQKPEPEPELPLEYRLKKDPLGTLAELGLGYDELTNLALNDGKLSTEMQMKLMREELETGYQSKIQELEEKLDSKWKQDEESKYEQTVTGFKNEINQFVDSDPEAYELIAANNANDLIYEVIEEQYNETGNILEMKDAADAVEAYLYDEAQKLLKLKKLSVRQEASGEQKPNEQAQPSTTLSNAHSAQALNETDRKLSKDESVAKAASMLKWG